MEAVGTQEDPPGHRDQMAGEGIFFDFVQMAKEQKEKAIEQAVAAGRPAMPRAVRGKLLTKYLRNGTALCSRFQTGECREETCQEAHVCAVVNRTGRACEIRGAAGGPNRERGNTWPHAIELIRERDATTEEAPGSADRGGQEAVEAGAASPSHSTKSGPGDNIESGGSLAHYVQVSSSTTPAPQPKAPPIPRTPVPEPKFPPQAKAAAQPGPEVTIIVEARWGRHRMKSPLMRISRCRRCRPQRTPPSRRSFGTSWQ